MPACLYICIYNIYTPSMELHMFMFKSYSKVLGEDASCFGRDHHTLVRHARSHHKPKITGANSEKSCEKPFDVYLYRIMLLDNQCLINACLTQSFSRTCPVKQNLLLMVVIRSYQVFLINVEGQMPNANDIC